MTQFLVSLYGPNKAGGPVDENSDYQAHADYAKQIDAEGVLAFGAEVADPLGAISLGKNSDPASSSDPKDVLVGVYVLKVEGGIEEALAIAQRNPILSQGGYLEVRELAES